MPKHKELKEGWVKLLTFLSNITVKNIKFVIQAKYRKFIKKEYDDIYSPDNIELMLYKVSQCPQCYINGEMECCGCNFKEALTTDKKCKKGKF